MDNVWGNRIVKVYDYGGFEDHHLWKERQDIRVMIGPKTILYTISMMSSEFLKGADAYQPFMDLSSESLTINRKGFKQYFRRFWGRPKDVWDVKSIVEDMIQKFASEQDRDVIVLFENSIDSNGEITDTILDIMFQNSPYGKLNNELILAPNFL
ncbi:hypothetical protein BOTNAR_0413g00020 [Botryotinia narcissicola]|uniref:Uncharacterized protein n=1 Tax=Botryotinia narcissicola TaxID=278944 RepID=A0A4Z1HT59_9HELO|nr:hypothetical protein BOTNAR_0413g00020 [Botryotinia narcissicola]